MLEVDGTRSEQFVGIVSGFGFSGVELSESGKRYLIWATLWNSHLKDQEIDARCVFRWKVVKMGKRNWLWMVFNAGFGYEQSANFCFTDNVCKSHLFFWYLIVDHVRNTQ